VDRALHRAQELGFLGDPPLAQQVAHAWGFATALAATGLDRDPGSFLDLGSGGGLPGLVLAVCWPGARGVLLDANQRRSAALQEVVVAAGWGDRIQVVLGRAEQAGHDPALRGTQEVVVARSFGPPAVVAECAAPFLEVGGWLVVSEPPAEPSLPPGSSPQADSEPAGVPRVARPDRWPTESLAIVGLAPVRFQQGESGYQVLRQVALCPSRYPRREGVPSKRPLYR